jgi:hypothetical protein
MYTNHAGAAIPKIDKPKKKYFGSRSLEHILPDADVSGNRDRHVSNNLLKPVFLGKRVSKPTQHWSEANATQHGKRYVSECALLCV